MGLRMGPNVRTIDVDPTFGKLQVSEGRDGRAKVRGVRIHKDISWEQAGRLILKKRQAEALRDYLIERYGLPEALAAPKHEPGPVPGAMF